MSDRRVSGPILKRFLDVFFAFFGLVATTPLLVVVAVAIRVTMGSPILFRHTRPGLHGRPFEMLKFRTMTGACDREGRLLPADERLTRLGILLRKWSVDELPELWNVLKGDMSLVGPRPLLMEYLPLYAPAQMRRHDMKPGITGLAQVKGRHKVGWEERFRLDVFYVDHWTLRLDVAIMRATIGVLFEGQGEVNPKEEDHFFTGSKLPATTETSSDPVDELVRVVTDEAITAPAGGDARAPVPGEPIGREMGDHDAPTQGYPSSEGASTPRRLDGSSRKREVGLVRFHDA